MVESAYDAIFERNPVTRVLLNSCMPRIFLHECPATLHADSRLAAGPRCPHVVTAVAASYLILPPHPVRKCGAKITGITTVFAAVCVRPIRRDMQAVWSVVDHNRWVKYRFVKYVSNKSVFSLLSADNVHGSTRICCWMAAWQAVQQSIDISCPPRPHASSSSSGVLHACGWMGHTDRRTEGRTDARQMHRPCSAYYI